MRTDLLVTNVIEALREAGYSENTISQRRSIYKSLLQYMAERELTEYSPKIGEEFLPPMQERRTYIAGKRECKHAIDSLNTFLSGVAFDVPRGKRKREKIVRYPEFDKYLEWCAVKGLTQGTLNNYHDLIRRIANGFESLGINNVAQINMRNLIDFCETLIQYTLSEKHNTVFVLKNLLHYLHEQGHTSTDFSQSVLNVRYDHRSRIPSIYSKDEVNRLLDAIVTDSPVSKRDYATALLAARTGMRRSDIAKLTFDSIDWENDKIEIVQGKTKVPLILPLHPDVGNAISEYILNHRPISDSECIFLTHVPPYLPMKPGTLNDAVSKALDEAGIDTNLRKKGPHALRHSFASEMLSRGISLKSIADALGHQSIQTTTIYAKVDTHNLVHCALPVPEHKIETHSINETLEKPIVGKLAPYIVDFITYKRSVGQKADTQLKLLRSFAVFSLGYDLSDCLLPESLVKDWSHQRENEKQLTCVRRVQTLQQFAQYLNNLGHNVFISVHMKSKKHWENFTPHIFSDDELKRFFDAADSFHFNGASVISEHELLISTLFRVLLGCGIRISEALRLKLSDVDVANSTLRILQSKNNKDRFVVMDSSLTQAMKRYLTKNAGLIRAEGYVFAKDNGDPLSDESAYAWFRKILSLAQISHGGKGYGPRLHDLRHTFSVRSLNKMLSEGKSLYTALPILKDYLGHADISDTEQYVRLVEWMFPDIIAATNKISEQIIPRLDMAEL